MHVTEHRPPNMIVRNRERDHVRRSADCSAPTLNSDYNSAIDANARKNISKNIAKSHQARVQFFPRPSVCSSLSLANFEKIVIITVVEQVTEIHPPLPLSISIWANAIVH